MLRTDHILTAALILGDRFAEGTERFKLPGFFLFSVDTRA